MKELYRYAVEVTRVVDGDTLMVDVDLGFRVWLRDVKFRLRGINCPEIASEAGIAAKVYVEGCVDRCKGRGVADTIKVDKYGNRWDAVVYLGDSQVSLNDLLVEEGHATGMGT